MLRTFAPDLSLSFAILHWAPDRSVLNNLETAKVTCVCETSVRAPTRTVRSKMGGAGLVEAVEALCGFLYYVFPAALQACVRLRASFLRASACVLPACVCPCVRTLRLGCALSCAYPRRACVCMRASSCVRLPLRARSAKGLWRGVGERPLRGLYNGPASSSIGHHQFREEASTRSAR